MAVHRSRRTASRGRAHAHGSGAVARAFDWLNDYDAVSKWMLQYDVHGALRKGHGIAWFPNFLPEVVAQGALAMLERLPTRYWNATDAGDNRASNNIPHAFWSVKSAPGSGVEALLRIFPVLVPDAEYSTFSAARYDADHHIAPHDDRAYTAVQCEDGSIVECSRDIAVVYYLTKDWSPNNGGQFIDLEGGGAVEHSPTFNTAVAFKIPRWHQVAPVLGDRPRYSIFGWFLSPGRAYALDAAVEGLADESMEPTTCKLGRRLLQLTGN